jgi:hypothetical protein
MSACKINIYWQALTIIDAREAMLKVRIASYTKMKDSERSKFYNSLFRLAHPNQEKRALRSEDFIGALKAKGFNG